LLLSIVALVLFLPLAGCGKKGPQRVKVTGVVKYPDGSVPMGKIRIIRFEPASMATGKPDPNTKVAQADLKDDGSFELSTVDQYDGAMPGDYKITLTVRDEYTGGKSLIDPKFAMAATTPLSRTVKAGEKNHFDDLVVEKAP
jgi:hypothetical protein